MFRQRLQKALLIPCPIRAESEIRRAEKISLVTFPNRKECFEVQRLILLVYQEPIYTRFLSFFINIFEGLDNSFFIDALILRNVSAKRKVYLFYTYCSVSMTMLCIAWPLKDWTILKKITHVFLTFHYFIAFSFFSNPSVFQWPSYSFRW